MSKFAVYGEGHLADALRAELTMHRVLDDEGCELAFAAQDITDHRDPDQLAEALSAFKKASLHRYAVVLSQVPPGWMRRAVRGCQGIFYQVDTIIVKQAVARMLRPEQFIIGCADPEAPLPFAYQEYLALHDCPVLQMSYESAEVAKCAINYMLAAQVRIACELFAASATAGANYEDVCRAMRNDARIGPRAYLRPGKLNRHLDRDIEAIAHLLAESR